MADEPDVAATIASLDEAKATPESKLEADKALFEKIQIDRPVRKPRPKPEKKEKAPKEEPKSEPEVAEEVEAPAEEEAPETKEEPKKEPLTKEEVLEVLELRKRLEALEAEKAKAEEKPPEPPKPLLDPTPLVAAFNEILGEEQGAALVKAIEDYISQPLEQIGSRLGGLESTWQEEKARSSQQIVEANRARLQEVVPQLKNDVAWEAITSTAQLLLQNNGRNFQTAEELFNASVEALYGTDALTEKEAVEEEEEDTKKQKKRIRSSLLTTESRKTVPEPGPDESERNDRAVFDRIMKKKYT